MDLIYELHHDTCSRPEEAVSLAPVHRHLRQRTDSAHHTLAPLIKADYVLTGDGEFIFDAIHVDKRVILLDLPGINDLLDGKGSCSTAENVDRRIHRILSATHDVAELRYLLSKAFDWGSVQAQLVETRHHYRNTSIGDKAGEQAMIAIVEALG